MRTISGIQPIQRDKQGHINIVDIVKKAKPDTKGFKEVLEEIKKQEPHLASKVPVKNE